MLRGRITTLLMVAVVSATACDRTPVAPADGGLDMDGLLFGSEAGRGSSTPRSLPALVQAAILTVYTEHGANAARSMVTDLRRLQDDSRAGDAADRETAHTLRRALQDEQLGIVLRVFGDEIVSRIIEATRADAAGLADRVAALDSTQPAAARARDLLAQVAELLADAETAAASGAVRPSLEAATAAAAQVDAIILAIAESLRVPALEELFDEAAARASDAAGSRGVQSLLRQYQRLQQEAQQAVRTGNRESAHAALAAVRAEQVTVVLNVLGDGVVPRLIERATAARHSVTQELSMAERAGADVARVERMLGSAGDLIERSRAAYAAGDAALALDLSSHAAGLINAARLAL